MSTHSINEAAKLFAEWTANNPSTTLCFDSTYEGMVRVEWQTAVRLDVAPTDLGAVLTSLETLDAFGALTY